MKYNDFYYAFTTPSIQYLIIANTDVLFSSHFHCACFEGMKDTQLSKAKQSDGINVILVIFQFHHFLINVVESYAKCQW